MYLKLNGLLHGSQMHRDVGGIRDQPPIRPKKGTGEVKAFFDVGRNGCTLQDAAHLFWGHRVTRYSVASNFSHVLGEDQSGIRPTLAVKLQSMSLDLLWRIPAFSPACLQLLTSLCPFSAWHSKNLVFRHRH